MRGIDHVGVTVPDIEEATRFFIEAFDAQVMYSPLPKGSPPRYGAFMEQRLGVPARSLQHCIRYLRLPNGPGIELFEFTNITQKEPAVPTDFGWQHVAFYVDDIHAALERVVAAGGRALTDPNPLPGVEAGPNNWFVYARTPWDSTVELISYPDPQPYEEITPLRRWRP
ncbi:MAG: VOC family protein [Dermatophilus congolensis]|nr:VOC family protein [Dermatophilus congolensis]